MTTLFQPTRSRSHQHRTASVRRRDRMSYIVDSHHITLSVNGAQEDGDFHVKVLGLRLIKRTVLFDGTIPIYHLYYSNADGDPSAVLTTFPFAQAGIYGRRGTNQAREVLL